MSKRNYAALPHDYLEEMETLTDAEFGRLCRALLQYSAVGTLPKLDGNERVLLKRVTMQEDRFQQSYEDTKSAKKDAGKKGAAKRWQTIADDSKNSRPMADDSRPMADDSKNGYTNTNTKTNTNTITPSIEGEARARVDGAEKPKNTRFVAPTVEQVREYCTQKGYDMDAEAFVDHYESNGWMVGKSKMRSWQAAVRNWQSREREFRPAAAKITEKPGRGVNANGTPGSYEMAALRRLHGLSEGGNNGNQD
jgi:hypothetical protein